MPHRFETLSVHAGSDVDSATGAVTPPIHLSTTFERAPDTSFPSGFSYTRSGNPTRRSLEICLAALEGGADAAAFSSGQAATFAVFQSLGPGAHVVAPEDAYYGTPDLLLDHFGPWGLESTLVDMTDLDAVRGAMRPNTRLVWIETPSNPRMKVTDIAAVAAIARECGALVACDNTWATPLLQRPFALGADIVMHSTTKYLGGHSDILGGALVTRVADDLWTHVRKVQVAAGGVPSPFECWLVMRGVRSLAWRMRGHSFNALAIARYLSGHPGVELVHYPGLERDPGYAVASRQMAQPGGMLSFLVKGGRDEAVGLTNRLEVFTRATSLGGPESLIEHRASIEGPRTRAPENLLRVSVGLEHHEDLIEDLDQALSRG
jgi:cystathionine gamma-synthase